MCIADNHVMMHTPTWYDAHAYTRTMWRATVYETPPPLEARSWLPPEAKENGAGAPAEGAQVMAGLEGLRWDEVHGRGSRSMGSSG